MLSITRYESSPISPVSGVKVFSFLERSRTATALPRLPFPRSDVTRIANRSSSVVWTLLKRCGCGASS